MSDQPIVDELDRPIDVERTLDQAPPRDPDAGAPPSPRVANLRSASSIAVAPTCSSRARRASAPLW